MAHRIISQVVFTGARVFGRAFAEAYKQASASQKYAAAQAGSGNPTAANTFSSAGLTLDEACRILNVSPPKGGQAPLDRIHEQFKRLFDLNDPKKGGSFYLQSKVLRARERLEMEAQRLSRQSQQQAQASSQSPPQPPPPPSGSS